MWASRREYASHSFLATKLAFIHEIADLCDLAGADIDALRLAFKPEADDVRESPEVAFISKLREQGAHIRASDPQALGNAR
jgi:UDP-glucose 6-dehydrogenase